MSIKLIKQDQIDRLGKNGWYLQFQEKGDGTIEWEFKHLNILQQFLRWMGCYYKNTHLKGVTQRLVEEIDLPRNLSRRMRDIFERSYFGDINPFPKLEEEIPRPASPTVKIEMEEFRVENQIAQEPATPEVRAPEVEKEWSLPVEERKDAPVELSFVSDEVRNDPEIIQAAIQWKAEDPVCVAVEPPAVCVTEQSDLPASDHVEESATMTEQCDLPASAHVEESAIKTEQSALPVSDAMEKPKGVDGTWAAAAFQGIAKYQAMGKNVKTTEPVKPLVKPPEEGFFKPGPAVWNDVKTAGQMTVELGNGEMRINGSPLSEIVKNPAIATNWGVSTTVQTSTRTNTRNVTHVSTVVGREVKPIASDTQSKISSIAQSIFKSMTPIAADPILPPVAVEDKLEVNIHGCKVTLLHANPLKVPADALVHPCEGGGFSDGLGKTWLTRTIEKALGPDETEYKEFVELPRLVAQITGSGTLETTGEIKKLLNVQMTKYSDCFAVIRQCLQQVKKHNKESANKIRSLSIPLSLIDPHEYKEPDRFLSNTVYSHLSDIEDELCKDTAVSDLTEIKLVLWTDPHGVELSFDDARQSWNEWKQEK